MLKFISKQSDSRFAMYCFKHSISSLKVKIDSWLRIFLQTLTSNTSSPRSVRNVATPGKVHVPLYEFRMKDSVLFGTLLHGVYGATHHFCKS